MNSRSTWFLVFVALVLGGWLYWTDGNISVPGAGKTIRFASPAPQQIVAIEFLRTNLAFRVERTAGGWRMKSPVDYPAQTTSIEAFLNALEQLKPASYIESAELAKTPDGARNFGFDAPGNLTIQTKKGPWMLLLGNMAPMGNRFYFRRVGDDVIFLADASFLKTLPSTVAEWRDHGLFDLGSQGFDRIEITGRTDLEAARDTNGQWRLTRPLQARANSDQFDLLVERLKQSRVTAFASDSPSSPLEGYGLQPPVAQIALKRGSNDVARLQFGSSPTNFPGEIYVRRSANTNIVQTEAGVVALLQKPLAMFRDRRLLPSLTGVDSIESVVNGMPFTLQRNGTNWQVGKTNLYAVDPQVAAGLLQDLARLTISDYPDDVVADPARYGLDNPRRRYSFRGTNGAALILDFGVPYGSGSGQDKVYVKRSDEPSVYGIPNANSFVLPVSAAQLRSWQFEVTNISEVTINFKGRQKTLLRGPTGEWRSEGALMSPAVGLGLDETLYAIANVKSRRLPSPPEATLDTYAFGKVDHGIAIQLREPTPFKSLKLQFGGSPSALNQFVLAEFDGGGDAVLLIEFPVSVYSNAIVNYLTIPAQ